ncbi:hypothetical protein IMCC3317_17660 [Kordia antarctica]|uniref:VWFA domain-containing protein n=1 Tax=Kordia antarctica TaxID=1218801 RepID=A0A7L4ZI40_9FLAO|nr:VWA domain-containing protein [Kordia antarctica]QHI36403.1 hypothetical protein IMCC3317_17660 [Kordia antarctica]
MRSIIVFYSLLISFVTYSQPHAELIDSLTNGMTVNLEHGDRFDISVKKIKINGFNYIYGNIYALPAYILLPKKYPIVYKKIVFVLEKNNVTYVVNDLRDQFQGESGEYKMYLNVNTDQDIEISGSIFVLNKESHLNRNKYNKVAKGMLIRKSGSIFIDEDGMEWELQNQIANIYHNPAQNAKFLHKVKKGGEYETIRRIYLCEGEKKRILSSAGIIEVISVQSDTLRGCNIIDPSITKKGGTYNFGQTSLMSIFPQSEHSFFDIQPHGDIAWGNNYNILDTDYPCLENPCEKFDKDISYTLFLIDRSGSMAKRGISGKPKIQEAKEAAIHSLNSMQNNQEIVQEVGFLTFSGGCISDPTANQSLGFSSNIQFVQNSINTISNPNGGTPLKEAIDAATQRFQNYVTQKGSNSVAKLIVLSDGVSSCSKIRPSNVYAKGASYFSKNTFFKKQIIVRYYTIGFDIKPGSEAERDLQYLAERSGGKYLNAKNELELTRAFQRFFKQYTPKKTPISIDLSKKQYTRFNEGIESVNKENYREAKDVFKELSIVYTNDYNIIFNLALMYEANNYFIHAIEMFKKYLQLNPRAKDSKWVLQQIELLQNDYKIFIEYTKRVVNKDLEYLNIYFKKVQNGESLKLAEEFKGFIKEKVEYYKNLPEIFNIGNKHLVINCKEISRSLNKCSKIIRKNSTNWDKNAIPFLSQIYLNLKKLAENW